MKAPCIAVPPGSFPDWTGWPSFADRADPALKGYAAYDACNLYLVLDIAQQGPIYAGEGRGIALYDDGVALRFTFDKEVNLLQLQGDAGGVMWPHEKLKPVSAGALRLMTQCEPGKGYKLCFVLPWARFVPQVKSPESCRIKIIHKRVTKPLKYEYKSFSVAVELDGKADAPVPAKAAALAPRPAERVMNFGRPGFTSAQVLEMLPVVLDSKPKLVVVMVGNNDMAKNLTHEETAENLRKMLLICF